MARHVSTLHHTSAAAAVAIFLLIGASAKADQIIYSNFSQGVPFISGGGDIFQGNDPYNNFASETRVAMGFMPSQDFTITTIEVGMEWIFGTNRVTLSLESSNAGGLPDQILESWDVVALAPRFTFGGPTEVLSNSVEVQGGKQYWLVAAPGDPTTVAMWDRSPNPPDGQPALRDVLGFGFLPFASGESRPSLQISGIPVGASSVPEIDTGSTATAITLLAGVLLVVRGGKKLHGAYRI